MAIENLAEVKTWLETQKDNEEVKTYIGSFKVEPTLEVFKSKLNDAEFKSFLDSTKDSHASKSLETWKANNLQKEIDAEIKKRFPDADPKDVKMKELELKLEQMQKESVKKELTNTAIKTATEKNIPVQMIDYLLGSDLETTNKNIETFETIFNESVQKQVEARLSSGSYTPPKGNNHSNTEIDALEIDRVAALTAGNMPLAIAIKNKMVALQNKK